MYKRMIPLLLALIMLLFAACGKPSFPAPEQPSPSVISPPPEPSESPAPEPADADLVRITDYLPGVFVELKYATEDNFTGEVIYDFSEAYLRYGTIKLLKLACDQLSPMGYTIKIWDAYRPLDAQRALWEVCPDGRFVSNPDTGACAHCCGDAVDITLVMADGAALEMPTSFDDFTALADRDYSDVSPSAAANALILENAMTAAGFIPYTAEWWHYSDPVDYPKELEFIPE